MIHRSMLAWRALTAATLCGWTLVGCASTEPTPPVVEQLDVLFHPIECVGITVQGCLLVKSPEATEYTPLFDGVQGFALEWGANYRIEVNRYAIEHPPADGPSVRRELRTVLAKKRVVSGTQFDMVMTGNGPVQPIGTDRYRWFNGPEFDCRSGGGCVALAGALAAGGRIRFRLEIPAALDLPLNIVSWQACPSADPGSSCLP